jgi:hypothetical protein
MSFTEPLQLARRTHCDILAASGVASVTGSCLFAAIVLQMMVELYRGYPCAVIRGGDGEGDGGYVDAAGQHHGHYWVEATDAGGERFVLDVTADQFAGQELVQLPIETAMQLYHPGDQATVDHHVAEERKKLDVVRAAQDTSTTTE